MAKSPHGHKILTPDSVFYPMDIYSSTPRTECITPRQTISSCLANVTPSCKKNRPKKSIYDPQTQLFNPVDTVVSHWTLDTQLFNQPLGFEQVEIDHSPLDTVNYELESKANESWTMMYLDMYLIKTSIQLTVREYSKTERKVKVKKINNPLIVKRAAVGPLSFEQIFLHIPVH